VSWLAFQLPSDAPCEVLRDLMRGYANTCAAWLISTHRRKLRRFGVFYIQVSLEDEPRWLYLAADLLSTRGGWDVSWMSTEESRVYRFARQSVAVPTAQAPN